jgi:hypothetical protein
MPTRRTATPAPRRKTASRATVASVPADRMAFEAVTLLRETVRSLDEIAALQHDIELLRTPTAPPVQHRQAQTSIRQRLLAITRCHAAAQRVLRSIRRIVVSKRTR